MAAAATEKSVGAMENDSHCVLKELMSFCDTFPAQIGHYDELRAVKKGNSVNVVHSAWGTTVRNDY